MKSNGLIFERKDDDMINAHEPSPFALAAESLDAFLKSQVKPSDDDIAKIVIPGWRYDQLAELVLKMYEDADARVMPLDVFSIANSIGCTLIPYRAFGQQIHDVLLQASEDALTFQMFGAPRPAFLYNDRQPAMRINFSIMHEIGHEYAGHLEPSPLAEKEANYFAGLALCPVDLLAHYGITDPKTVCELFNVSYDVAENRLRTVKRKRNIMQSDAERRFHRAVIERFRFRSVYQMELFSQVV